LRRICSTWSAAHCSASVFSPATVVAAMEAVNHACDPECDRDRADHECLDEAEPPLVYDTSVDGKVEAG
jgi:hypothetical protein